MTSRFKCCISSHIKTTWNGLLWDNVPFNKRFCFFFFVWHKRHFFFPLIQNSTCRIITQRAALLKQQPNKSSHVTFWNATAYWRHVSQRETSSALFWQLYNHLWKINQCLRSHLNRRERSDAFFFFVISACQTRKCGKWDFSKLLGSLNEYRPSLLWWQMSP